MPTTMNRMIHKPSCDSLGACQCRVPACSGCTLVTDAATRAAAHAFAPGVITAHENPRHTRRRRWVRKALAWSVASVVISMAAGYVVGRWMVGV